MAENFIEIRGNEYDLYTDFTDDEFIAFARYRTLKQGQVLDNANVLGVSKSLKDEVADILNDVIFRGQLPQELLDMDRPSGAKIRLDFQELNTVFLQCYEVMAERNPEQWERIKATDIDKPEEKPVARSRK